MSSDRLLVSEVAEILGVSHTTVHKMIKRGHFPGAYRIDPTRSSRFFIPRTDLDAFIQKQRGQVVTEEK